MESRAYNHAHCISLMITVRSYIYDKSSPFRLISTMALSDEAVSKQIEHMIAFIKNESQEKVEEIYAKVNLRGISNDTFYKYNLRLTRSSKLKRGD